MTIKQCVLLFISILLLHISYSQASLQKQSIKVYGNCGQCKKKIEKSAISAGAASADWNEKTRILNVSYDPAISNPRKIETAIAGAGYDTRNVRATDSAYYKLDKCCRYDRKKTITSKTN